MNVEIIEKDAVISACQKYRYLLRRVWDHDRPRALFVMLNPSTADAEIDDPTIRSCIRLANAWGYGSFEVVNLFAWRATDPNELATPRDPVGKGNDAIICAALVRCDVAICAWGANKNAGDRGSLVRQIITSSKPVAYCLGTTKDGHPKHPLYIKTGTPLTAYRV